MILPKTGLKGLILVIKSTANKVYVVVVSKAGGEQHTDRILWRGVSLCAVCQNYFDSGGTLSSVLRLL